MSCRTVRRVTRALPAVALVAALAGCGGGGGGSKGATVTATNGAVSVGAHDIYYDVGTIKASPGKLTVTLTDQGALDHTFTVSSKNFDLAVSSSKKEATGTLDLQAGTYDFFCRIPGHSAQMHGKIEVG